MHHSSNSAPRNPFVRALHAGGLLLTIATVAFRIPAADAAAPPALFVKACAPCHGKDGKATTPAARKLGVKDLSLSQLNETEIQRQMVDGRTGPDGSIKMPSFREALKPADMELLARFVKSLQKPPKPPSLPSK